MKSNCGLKIEELLEKGRSYPKNFFYGDMLGDVKLYESKEGIFLLGKTSEEMELFWGVNHLDNLRANIEKIKKENPNMNFIFRYAGNLNDVIEKMQIINQWGYKNRDIYVGYFCNLDNIPDEDKHLSIEYLDKNEIDDFLLLERKVFDLLNITENQLINWLGDNKQIILVCKENKKIIGFTIIELYGENNKNCFIRDVGVDKSRRGRGIGKALLLNGLRKAMEKGALKAMLWVGYDNIIARSLYEKIGFKLDESEAEVVFQV